MTMREASKQEWNASAPPPLDVINAGSLQRIADAVGAIARDHCHLLAERDLYKTQADEYAERIEALLRDRRADRLRIARLRVRLKERLNPCVVVAE